VRLDEVELRRIALPFVTPFRTSFGTIVERDILVVHVRSAAAEGWGECVALGEPVYSAEWVGGAHEVLRRFLVPALLAAPDVCADDVAGRLAFVRGHQMAKAALEMAVVDAELRSAGQSLASRLGGARSRVEVGVSVGIAASIAELVATVAGYVDAGYGRVKLKIGPGWDIEPVAAVRAHVGADVMLTVDANCAYTGEDIEHLVRLDEHALALIEQPFGADDLASHVALAAVTRTPVCLDESIESLRDAAGAIDMGACSVVSIKPGRVGGYLEARRIHDLCMARDVAVWCGGMFETGIGRAANLALASLPGFTLPGDISASDRYYRTDITEPFVLQDGHITVPTGPGIGVEPRLDVLDRVTTSIERLRRR